jgi:hypothetical protein
MRRFGPPIQPYITPRNTEPYAREEEELGSFKKQELYEEERPVIKKEVLEQKKSWLKIKEERLKGLRLLGAELIGNIFERVKFLETRIGDIDSSLKSRQLINKKAIEEVTMDVDDKLSKLSTITDSDAVRDLQLDLTNLKMERRREVLLFWKDTLELQRELQQLKEQYVIESKIAKLFEGLKDGVPD